LPRLLRRTVLSALVAGAVGFVVGVMIAPLAGLGVVIGVGLAILNLRFLDRQVARVEIKGEKSTKAVRRQLGANTVSRLVLMTIVAIGALWLDAALGIGIVAGLVIYQIVFVINVLSVVANQGDGVHPTFHFLGMTFDSDIIASTLLAAAIFMLLVFLMTSKVTDGVPSKIQIFWEIIVGMVADLAESAMGERGKRFVPLGVTLFLFILICNWIGFLPTAMHPGQSGEIFPAPTGDVNLPLSATTVSPTPPSHPSTSSKRSPSRSRSPSVSSATSSRAAS
jgi:hypothetical protein